MGIFDFVKSAGAKIFKKEPDDKAETYKPLKQHVEEHGIKTDGMQFRFENGVLVVEGAVPDQDTREKVILIVGNVEGVAKVDDRLRVVALGSSASAPGAHAPLAGTAATPAPAPAGASAPASGGGGGAGGWSSSTYTVKKGDTLSAIAKATLGNANRYNVIFEANKPMLKHPDKIYPGQVLRIPAADSSAAR